MPELGRKRLRALNTLFLIVAFVWVAGAIVIVAWQAFHPPVTHNGSLKR